MKVMATPKSVEIAITTKCNLRCKYCSHFTSAGDVGNDLPKEEWLKFFEELNRCAVMDICLQGGEPFFRPDLREIIEGIVGNRMRFNILSNGTLITEEIAEFIAATRRCNGVQVSIDGADAGTHDSMRGEGSFLKAVLGIKILKKYKVSAQVRVTIHRKNVRNLSEIARFLLEDIGLAGFGTNSACYMGLCRKNQEMVQLTTEERSLAMKELLKLNKKYNGRIQATAGPLAEAKGWLMMEKSRQDKKGLMPGRGFLTGCGGAFSKLAVRADGVMVPCLMVEHIELGRINKDKLKEVWQNHPELNKFRARREIPLSDFEFCGGCDYMNYCTGSCPAVAYTILGKVNHPAPDSCLKRFLEEGGILPDENLLLPLRTQNATTKSAK